MLRSSILAGVISALICTASARAQEVNAFPWSDFDAATDGAQWPPELLKAAGLARPAIRSQRPYQLLLGLCGDPVDATHLLLPFGYAWFPVPQCGGGPLVLLAFIIDERHEQDGKVRDPTSFMAALIPGMSPSSGIELLVTDTPPISEVEIAQRAGHRVFDVTVEGQGNNVHLHLATSAALEAFQEDPPCLLDPAPTPCPVEARAVLRFLTAPDHPVYFARSGYHARFSLLDPTSPDSASLSLGKAGKVSFGMGSLSFVGPPFMAEIYMPVQYLLAPAP